MTSPKTFTQEATKICLFTVLRFLRPNKKVFPWTLRALSENFSVHANDTARSFGGHFKGKFTYRKVGISALNAMMMMMMM